MKKQNDSDSYAKMVKHMKKAVIYECPGFNKEILTLEQLGFEVKMPNNSNDLLKDIGQKADLLVIGKLKPLNEVPFEKVLYVIAHSVGVTQVPQEVLTNGSPSVMNLPGHSSNAVADYIFASLDHIYHNSNGELSKRRKIEENLNLNGFGGARGVESENIPSNLADKLKDRTISIYGLGQIGENFVGYLRNAGINTPIKYLSRSVKSSEELGDVQKQKSLDDLVDSDIFLVTASSNDETKSSITQSHIERLPYGSTFVNVAREEILTKDAYQLLIKKADLGELTLIEDTDLWHKLSEFGYTESLRSKPNVIITPHCAFNTQETAIRKADCFETVVKEYARFMAGEINSPLIYKR